MTTPQCRMTDLAADRAEIERLKGKLQARDGECKGKAEIIAQLEAERDEARAQMAMVYEVAAQTAKGEGESEFFNPVQAIRALASDHARAALEAYGREKVREGMQRAADLFKDANHGKHIMDAILAEMEALK